jgi:Tol biopolymer transport system component
MPAAGLSGVLAGMTIEAGRASAGAVTPVKTGIIAYEHITASGTRSIRTAAANGANEHLLAKFMRVFGNPTWSPDGKTIAFAGADELNGPFQDPGLYLMDADGANRTRLTVDDGAFPADPHYSPDGTLLVYTKLKGNLPGTDILTIRTDGSVITRLTDGLPGVHYRGPQWSPDGARILFTRPDQLGRNHIHVMRADGSAVQQLTAGENDDLDPTWSPDGTRIAFARRQFDAGVVQQDIWLMRSDGSGQHRLVPQDGLQNSFPAWSGDGTFLSFSRHNGQDWDLWATTPDGVTVEPLDEGLGSILTAEWR